METTCNKTAKAHREQIFFDSDQYFKSLLDDINLAREMIDLETYIFSLDRIGTKVIKALIEAAKRKVEVRVLVDGAGTPTWNNHLIDQLEAAGAQTRVFHPFPWHLWQWSRSKVKVPSLLKAVYLLLKINSRNHRKVCIIDKKIIYAGSFNICQQHLSTNQSGDGWRDTGIRLQNINIHDLNLAFESTWNHVPIQERVQQFFKHIRTNPVIRLNNTWYRRRILHKNLLRRIKNSKKRIWITNAYFVPDTFLLKRLRDAAKNGIDVRILLPNKSDVAFMPWASTAFYFSLLKSGVRIFEYLPNILHAKTLIIDDWMTIGSSNLNHRSLLHDLEVDVNIRLPQSKQALEEQFLLDLKSAKEIDLPAWQKRSFPQRSIGRMLLFLKYLM